MFPTAQLETPSTLLQKNHFYSQKIYFLIFRVVFGIFLVPCTVQYKQGGLLVEHRIIAAMGGSNNWLDLWMWWFFLSSITHFFAPLHFPFLLNLNQSGTEIWKEFLAIFSSTSIYDIVLFWDDPFLISVPAFKSQTQKSLFLLVMYTVL